jgi:hypothetical protein
LRILIQISLPARPYPVKLHFTDERAWPAITPPKDKGISRAGGGKKTELSRRHVGTIAHLKSSQSYLARATPELLTTLHRHHDTFRAMLQVNLTVLATAHAASEDIVRGVNTELQRRNVPNPYTATGQRAAPSPRNISPLAVSRSS